MRALDHEVETPEEKQGRSSSGQSARVALAPYQLVRLDLCKYERRPAAQFGMLNDPIIWPSTCDR